jgi:soluble lytic murein transglycosylase-like protein
MIWKTSSKCTPASASVSRLLAALALLAALWPARASADTFPYVDRDGQVHLITLSDAPAADSPPPPEPPVRAAPVPVRAPEPSRPFATQPFSRPPVPASRASSLRVPAPYLDIVREAAAHYSLPPALLVAVMRVESAFNARAVSRVGAMGLMQLMPATAQDMMVADPFDPRQNVFGGARLLRILVNRFDGNVVLALAGYSAGGGAVERWGGIPPYSETIHYVIDVLAIYHLLLVTGVEAQP